jgi:hypothetical protein
MPRDTTKSPSASIPSPPIEVVCLEFRHLCKGSLVGFATVTINGLLTIHGVGYFIPTDGKPAWCGWPRRGYKSKEGEERVEKLIEGCDTRTDFRLRAHVVKAVEKFLHDRKPTLTKDKDARPDSASPSTALPRTPEIPL